MSESKKNIPFIRRPWFAFFSSMRFAVALLSLLGIASVIGTVLQQNQPQVNYVVKFGPFWSEIFRFLGLYDVYASAWFVVIMLFLVISTSLCLIRNVPTFLREVKSYRLNAGSKSLAAMRHSTTLQNITPETAGQYLEAQGFSSKTVTREDGSVLVAAKKGAMNKWGYVFAHVALIVICLGGLIDSNLLLKIGMLTGKIVPDNSAVYAKDFKPESILGRNNLSFRGNVNITEGQSADVVFLNADSGMLVQDLPFDVKLKKFHIDFYNTGMPSNFASDLIVTDKQTGETIEQTIRVNHPLTLHGITIYQASFADGGSDLTFKAWNMANPSREPSIMRATSMREFPLNIGDAQYKLEFDQFTALNVENTAQMPSEKSRNLQTTLNDVLPVSQEGKKFTNLGPSVVYRIRDKAGQAVEYKNFMLPLLQEGDYFFITGTRTGLDQQYRWLRIPADRQNSIDTFMALREFLKDDAARKRVIQTATAGAPDNIRSQFAQAAENTLSIFAKGGYLALSDFVTQNIPQAEQEKMQGYFYEMLYGVMNAALDATISEYKLPAWPQDEKRNRFLINSMDAYTGLSEYPAPMLLQLNSFKEVRSSGLQMTRSPGESLVYFGSLLLVLGTVFMFYIREKRAWLLFSDGTIRFAMSSSRSERDLQKEFPLHVQRLQQLGQGAALMPSESQTLLTAQPWWRRLNLLDWLFAAAITGIAAFAQHHFEGHMDHYEVVILWLSGAIAIFLGWFFKPMRWFILLSLALAYLAVAQYGGHIQNADKFLLKYLLSSQSAIMWQCALVFFALFAYIVGAVVASKKHSDRNTMLDMGTGLGWASALAGFVGLLVRWHESYLLRPDAGHIPVSNLYEVFILFLVITALMYLYYAKRFAIQKLGAFVFTFMAGVVCFVLWYSISRDAHAIQPLIPALQSWWMKIHVPANFIGYGAFCSAAMLGVAELMALRKEAQQKKTWLPASQVIEEVMYKAIAVGFLFFTIATILGALWAADAWGRYWSWDPKETWAFIVWLNYAVWLHLRLVAGWRGKILAWWAIIGLFVTAFAFVGVNMFLSGLHSYGTL